MSTKTNIEWTDTTWNPIRGCSRVSPGCLNCYAERQAIRQSAPGKAYHGLVQITNGRPQWTGKVDFDEERLLEPLSWKTPRRVFVNSMSDLFHDEVTDDQRDHIFAVMALTPQHTYQVLTKRTERMMQYFSGFFDGRVHESLAHLRSAFIGRQAGLVHQARTGMPVLEWSGLPLPNVWLGTSVENQKYADERVPFLLQTLAAVRFISAEPLLGPIDLTSLPSASGIGRYLDSLSNAGVDPGALISSKLDWVICGGESGPGARPCNTEWLESIVNQCREAKTPCFVKQLGSHVIQGGERRKKADRKGGDVDEWPHEIRVREFPEVKAV